MCLGELLILHLKEKALIHGTYFEIGKIVAEGEGFEEDLDEYVSENIFF